MRRLRLRTDKNRVPIISNASIDAVCEAYIRDFQPEIFEEPGPVDIDSFIAFYMGLSQDFAYLSNDGRYLGMLVFNDTDRVVVYDPGENRAEYMSASAGTVIIDSTLLEPKKEHRYRFTAGHEAGHGILHADYFSYDPNQVSMFDDEKKEPMFQCRADAAAQIRKKDWRYWTPEERMEHQANRAASALLMPRTAVLRVIDEMPKGHDVDYEIMRVLAVANTFNVSEDSAMYRLSDLGILKNPTSSFSLLQDFGMPIE